MKYLKRFATHQQYLDYIANEVNSTHFVGTCDDDHTLEDPFKSHYITSKGKLILGIWDYYNTSRDERCAIVTGLVPQDNNWRFETHMTVKNYSVSKSYANIFGCYTGEAYNTYRVIRSATATNGGVLVCGNTKAGGGGKLFNTALVKDVQVKVILAYNSFTVINYETGAYIYNNATITTTQGSINTAKMILGGMNDCSTCWYSFDSYHNNELVQALRPFKRYSDGRRGMIDLLTGKEFYSTTNYDWLGSE